ncbi:hypothetical protein G9A89_000203, partial [Geosiphon pyriformis]
MYLCVWDWLGCKGIRLTFLDQLVIPTHRTCTGGTGVVTQIMFGPWWGIRGWWGKGVMVGLDKFGFVGRLDGGELVMVLDQGLGSKYFEVMGNPGLVELVVSGNGVRMVGIASLVPAPPMTHIHKAIPGVVTDFTHTFDWLLGPRAGKPLAEDPLILS